MVGILSSAGREDGCHRRVPVTGQLHADGERSTRRVARCQISALATDHLEGEHARMDFASWLTDIMARNRSTYVLGGQATLFRIKHLQQVTVDHERNSPWDPDAQVEDMELTWRLHEAGRKTLVSATARAYAGPMVTVKGLMGQRRKWDEGMAALLWQNKMPDKNTMIPWKQQFQMLANGLVRLMFAVMLLLALTVHQFVWSPIWLLPILRSS